MQSGFHPSHQGVTVRAVSRTPTKAATPSFFGECLMATQTDPVRHVFPRTTAPGISKRLKSYAYQSPSNLVRVGVTGYGYWGPNVVRNLQSLENCQLVTICDKNSDSLRRASRVCPGVELTMDFAELLNSPQIDAIAVVTPVWTHFELAKAALQNGKHVFV